jgi:hypothetical protein
MICLRFLFCCLFVLFFIHPGLAEKADAQRLEIGLTGGANANLLLHNFEFTSGEYHLDLSPNVAFGYNTGLIMRYGLTQNLRIQAEPSLAGYGSQFDRHRPPGANFETDSQSRFLYVQLPVLLHLTTAPPPRTVYGRGWPSTTFHATGGLFGGYLLDARYYGRNSGAPFGSEFNRRFSNDVTGQVSDFDAGVILGGGLEHGLRSKIGLEGRVHFSVLDSNKSNQFNLVPNSVAVTMAVYYLF